MPARAVRIGCVVVVLAALLVGCASGAEPGPTVTVTETVTPSPVSTPTPSPTSEIATDTEAWTTFASADGSISLSYPASWSVVEDSPSASWRRVQVLTPEGYLALEVSTFAAQDPPYTSPCDDPATVSTDYELVERQSFDPLLGALATTSASPLEIVTFTTDGSLPAISLAQSNHVEAGCVDQQIGVAGGSVRVTSPYGTDAPNVVSALFDSADEFLASTEHDVIVRVLESVRISDVPD